MTDFPTSPTIGQIYSNGTRNWRWSGVFWEGLPGAGPTGPVGIIGPTGPQGSPTDGIVALSSELDTSYTLSLADICEMKELDNASPITVTVPANSSVNFPVGAKIDFCQVGNGTVTFSPALGVIIKSVGGALSIADKYAAATIFQTETLDTWILIGNLA